MEDPAWATDLSTSANFRAVGSWAELLAALQDVADQGELREIRIVADLQVTSTAYLTPAHTGLIIRGVGSPALNLDPLAFTGPMFSADGADGLQIEGLRLTHDDVGLVGTFFEVASGSHVERCRFSNIRTRMENLLTGPGGYFACFLDRCVSMPVTGGAMSGGFNACNFLGCYGLALTTSTFTARASPPGDLINSGGPYGGNNCILGGFWGIVNTSATSWDSLFCFAPSSLTPSATDTVLCGNGDLQIRDVNLGKLEARATSGSTNVLGN